MAMVGHRKRLPDPHVYAVARSSIEALSPSRLPSAASLPERLISELPAGPAVVPPSNGSTWEVGGQTFEINLTLGRRSLHFCA